MKYVVSHYTRGLKDWGPDSTKQYLHTIHYNPYNKPREHLDTVYVDHREEAFHFTEKAAAEFAACFVGGYVEEYTE